MRKAICQGAQGEARELFARAPVVHLALAGSGGAPLLRAMNAVVVDGALAFHGAPAGEKTEGLGRAAVASAEEVVATIPSHFLDPARACPATTYYLSAQAHGVLEEVSDARDKARVLAALMAKYQPDGGYAPLDADAPLYAKAIRGVLIARLSLDRAVCKAKLGQNRTIEERARVIEGLWRRGDRGDARAVALLLDRFAELPAPSSLARGALPAGLRLVCHVDDAEVDRAADLLEGAYWLADLARARVREAIALSPARVGARDARGRLVAFARAVSDRKVAWLHDVIVAPEHRGAGVGRAVVALLLDHPEVRGARVVRLGTRDAMPFYRGLGFEAATTAPARPYAVTEMVRIRSDR